MVLVIDAYNVILGPAGVSPRSAGDLAAARARLAEVARGFLGRRFQEAILVFDGHPGATADPMPAGIRAVFAGEGPGAADRWIKEWVSARTRKERFAVVSSDREVASWASRHGGEVIASADFLAAAGKRRGGTAPPPSEPLSNETGLRPGEVENEMRYFGLDRDPPAAP